jgi:hypothetical protein
MFCSGHRDNLPNGFRRARSFDVVQKRKASVEFIIQSSGPADMEAREYMELVLEAKSRITD